MTASIHVKNLSLDVPIFVQRDHEATTWMRTLLGAATVRPQRQFRTLLDSLTFTVEEGDRLALIGRNGAGKSTLLRVLTGAFVPTRGVLEVTGTRQALLNIKLGFNKHATLAENIYLRGTAMGISSKVLRGLVRPVLEFAGLEEKAQDRLYTLSSGQRMRLGFAIATAVSQDIILMDEWLGAGDAAFLERAKQRMDDRVNGSKIVVLASHNANLVKRICNKGLVLSDGRIHYFGDVEEALKVYRKQVRAAKRIKRAEARAALGQVEGRARRKKKPGASAPAAKAKQKRPAKAGKSRKAGRPRKTEGAERSAKTETRHEPLAKKGG